MIKAAARPVVTAALSATGGPISIAMTIIKSLAGDEIDNLLSSAAESMYGLGNLDLANAAYQQSMSVSDWCAKYKGCPAGPAS